MKKILVIDDEDQILLLLTALFGNEGYEVFTAKDGKEGMRCFDTHLPDIVITDIVMPEMEGIDV
ncbi:MAG: response regulator, partial [Desulfobacteraceae bacterium]|nr:response regulator [Desulfobacteraceae bacterium]